MLHARPDYQNIQDINPPVGRSPVAVDEPVFLLRAQDQFAAAVVRYWAMMVAGADGMRNPIACMAMQHADTMDAWGTKKIPDLPETPGTPDLPETPGTPDLRSPRDKRLEAVITRFSALKGKTIDVIPKGSEAMMCSCPSPSHPDLHPSCSVNLITGAYRCLACGIAGTVDFTDAKTLQDQIIKTPKIIRVYVASDVPIDELKNLRAHLDAARKDPDYEVITNYPVAFSEAFVGSGEVEFEFISKDFQLWTEADIRAAWLNSPAKCDMEALDAIIEALKGGAS